MINRWAFYGLTVLSCALLAGIFISRGDTWLAVGIMVVALIYVVRGIISTRNEKEAHRRSTVEAMADVHTTTQKREVLKNLLETRNHLRGGRQRFTLMGLLVAIAAAMTYPTSGPIAWAISALLLPLGYLIVRNSRAIGVIERGLTERGYSY